MTLNPIPALDMAPGSHPMGSRVLTNNQHRLKFHGATTSRFFANQFSFLSFRINGMSLSDVTLSIGLLSETHHVLATYNPAQSANWQLSAGTNDNPTVDIGSVAAGDCQLMLENKGINGWNLVIDGFLAATVPVVLPEKFEPFKEHVYSHVAPGFDVVALHAASAHFREFTLSVFASRYRDDLLRKDGVYQRHLRQLADGAWVTRTGIELF